MTFPFKNRVAQLASAFIIVFGLVVAPLYAQEAEQSGNGFRISPVRTEYVIEKGRSETLTLTIENPANVPTQANLVVNDFVASEEENGEPRLILNDNEQAPKNSFKELVGSLETIQLGPSEKKDIPVTIKIPENANAGGYYGAVRVVPVTTGVGDANVGLTASVGSIVLVRVPGPLTERLDLIEFTSAQNGKAKSFFTGGNVSSLIRLKNEGDIHVKPFGKVQVKNMFGKVVHEYELNLDDQTNERDNVLPGTIRKFEDGFPEKKYLGRYSIVANVGYGDGGELITAQTTFWYMPWWTIAIILLVIAALVAAGYVLYKKYSVPRPKHGVKKR